MSEHSQDPGKRKAQHLLAAEVLELVHGAEIAAKTQAEHQAMRTPTLASLSRQSNSELDSESADLTQRTKLPRSLVHDTPFGRLLYHAGLVGTKSEGARLISKGGVYIARADRNATDSRNGELNFTQIKEQQPSEVASFVVDGLLILRLGKWKVRVIEVVPDEDFDAGKQHAPGWDELKTSRNR